MTNYLHSSNAVLPDSPNFPYRRYERLPPINQFSIESDSDLSETAELIEEYEVFDPSRPRPKVILIIGKPKNWVHHHMTNWEKLQPWICFMLEFESKYTNIQFFHKKQGKTEEKIITIQNVWLMHLIK